MSEKVRGLRSGSDDQQNIFFLLENLRKHKTEEGWTS